MIDKRMIEGRKRKKMLNSRRKNVNAKVRKKKDENKKSFISHLNKHCQKRLQNYKTPVKIKIVEKELYSDRFKKIRHR